MEVHCGENVLFFVEEDTKSLPDMETFSNAFGNWVEESHYVPPIKDTLIYREADPLLSEAQIFDPSLEEYDIRIPQPEYVPKEEKHIERYQAAIAVLRSVNNTTDQNMNTSKTNSDNVSKNDIVMATPPDTVEMNFSGKEASLVFKKADGEQIFLTQHMELPENYTRPENIQKIKSVCLLTLCKELDIKLPQIITTLGAKIHLCPLKCSKAFLHFAAAKLHALKHMQIKPYKCNQPNCSWEFYTACKLARHKSTHSKNKLFICDIKNCNKTFSTIYNLNDHKKKHNKPATLPCPVKNCKLLFQNEKQRRSHYKTHDHTEASFHCNIGNCTKSFFTKALLDVHSRYCSLRESEIKCSYSNCGKIFPNPYRLREHVRQHTGLKPYQCDFEKCPWSFATASKLKRHKSIHTGDRKFHCTMGNCNKSFLRSEHLKEHTLTHIEKRVIDSEGKLSGSCNTKKSNVDKKPECTKVRPEEDSVVINTNPDILLEQAIKSLGVPSDVILGAGIITDDSIALLENEKFSTVNLRDLD